ncbi:hypothetical protein M422DRAFT_193606 [Sphaerobolus stellatus SS14]|uniref:Fungal pheromone STE3G-protein-coupled receptor n=1 Tax=Sphaerobolus stellatus (strain SS14) TaxID=990650 RepID=A0A0C9U8E4_SPHS4|nr:hypothetical protein M422DRAFT_193606 [Sphaerobolus stellatus SS14]
MKHPEFPIVSFLLVPFLLSSLPSHVRAKSVAIISLVAWLTVMNLIRGINSIIWADNVVIKLQVWCDITTKLLVGFTFAVPLSALCICRQLEQVSSTRQTYISHTDKRRRMIFEAFLCFGVPMIFMGLHYIVQGHRYDLLEEFGCYPTSYFSLASVFLMWVPPLIISLISMMLALAAFHHFLKRRIEFASVLRNSNSAISPARYFRLMALAVFEIFWDTGTNIYILYYNTFTGLRPWISWQNVHSNFSRVGLFPIFLVPTQYHIQTVIQWWIIPISSVAFILFFGFGEEAKNDYRVVIQWIRRNILRQKVKPTPLVGHVLPLHR